MSRLACNTCDCALCQDLGFPKQSWAFSLLFFLQAYAKSWLCWWHLDFQLQRSLFLPFLPSFKLQTADTNIPDLASHLTVQPQKGVLTVSKHLVQVELLFHPKMEMAIEDKPILHCRVSCLGWAVLAHRVLRV